MAILIIISVVAGGWIMYKTSVSTKMDFYPEFDIPIDKMNQSIRLLQPPGDTMDLYNSTGLITVYIENLSDERILFPPDYNVRVLVKEADHWNLIPNNFDYSTIDNLLPTKAEYAPGLVVFVKPVLPRSETVLTVRIMVFGRIANTDRQVGAYIDLPLTSE